MPSVADSPKHCRVAIAPLLLLFLLLSPPLSTWAAPNPTSPIRTIVVLVMENRSFDHILGWMQKMLPSIDGVTGDEWNPVNVSDPAAGKIHYSDKAEFVDPDPGHEYVDVREQIFGGEHPPPPGTPAPMTGFATNADKIFANLSHRVMSGFRPEVLPAYAALAQEFAVVDRWFSSVPGPTQPNRLYIHSGTSSGLLTNDEKALAAGLPQRTIFDDLTDDGFSIGVYFQHIPSVLCYRRMRALRYVKKFRYWSRFKIHAAAGKLPNYTVLEPRYFDLNSKPANDDHPSHDVAEGQKLVKEVYDTLRKSPQWNETLLIITYDEHGGFYDHVPTPLVGVPRPDDIVGTVDSKTHFDFDRLGVRVPTFLISPWINKGIVLHSPINRPTPTSEFEHSSIPATVRKLFNLTSPPLTKREEWAGTFDDVLRLRETPRTDCPEELPNTPWSLRHAPPDNNRRTTEFQDELVELAMGILGIDASIVKKKWTVGEADKFVESAVALFLKAADAAVKAGVDETTIVQV